MAFIVLAALSFVGTFVVIGVLAPFAKGLCFTPPKPPRMKSEIRYHIFLPVIFSVFTILLTLGVLVNSAISALFLSNN